MNQKNGRRLKELISIQTEDTMRAERQCPCQSIANWYLQKKKFYGVHPFQRRVENKLIKRIEDRFEDKLLCESMKTLTPKQYQVIILFLKDKNTDEIAQEVGTTPGNVRKLRKRALEKLRTEYARLAMGCHEDFNGMIPYNIKRLNRCLDQPKHKKKRKKAA